eukprot:CAMPEP_0172923536 /NCGR_PEP_ID=MMETSP1075-20121228/209921_1 /TAXON_ID=2916 /ORGANISM="Ceratium fusus, Strain PA161109" /LENGTH=100 /DNA_ID=CAMNT_0013784037 /DNA_START=475 /DNA_END=777 /DNA_ORIENTATION=-
MAVSQPKPRHLATEARASRSRSVGVSQPGSSKLSQADLCKPYVSSTCAQKLALICSPDILVRRTSSATHCSKSTPFSSTAVLILCLGTCGNFLANLLDTA